MNTKSQLTTEIAVRRGGMVRPVLVILASVALIVLLFYAAHIGFIPVWLEVALSIIIFCVMIAHLADYLVKDLVLPEDYVHTRYGFYFSTHPEALDHLNDLLIEPEGYESRKTPLEKLLSHTRPSSHPRLTSSRRTDREILRLCADDSKLSLSFEDIARRYGTTEKELILFLYSRRPNTLYRRIYFRSFLAENSDTYIPGRKKL